MNDNKNKKVQAVVLSDCGGSLTAKIFASGENLVSAFSIKDCSPTQAAQLHFSQLGEADFVVRSVKLGKQNTRRKIELLQGNSSALRQCLLRDGVTIIAQENDVFEIAPETPEDLNLVLVPVSKV